MSPGLTPQSAAQGSRERRPRVQLLVPRFLQALGRRGWVAARTLMSELDVDARELREAASKSEGRIIGNQRGYVLTTQAALEDVHAVSHRLLSQSTRMRDRVLQIEHVRHAGRGDLGGLA